LVGHGENLVDSTFIANAAAAHVAAADRLCAGAPCAGRVYFISNGQPVPIRELIDRILAAGGLPPVARRISPRFAYALGASLESVYRLCLIEREPPMTRFVARQLCTAHWFDLSAARRDLGYEPEVSLEEGFQRLKTSLVE
jgi:nucleoside-diphosphate-sugar epimerase